MLLAFFFTTWSGGKMSDRKEASCQVMEWIGNEGMADARIANEGRNAGTKRMQDSERSTIVGS